MKPQPVELSRRRLILTGTAGLASGALLLRNPARAQDHAHEDETSTEDGRPRWDPAPLLPGEPGKDYTPVVTPNNVALPWKIVDGVKVFHLIAEEVAHEFAPGLKARCWGYNGRVHGPTIEAVEGDRVRIYVTNRLPAPTSVHWHGVLLPNGMDGVAGLNQRAIAPGETFKYEFTLRQHGTLMYHPHHDEMTQMALGMMGMFVIHPRTPPEPRVDRDFAFMLTEWKIVPGTSRPDPNEMTDFNVLTFNARASRARRRWSRASATACASASATSARWTTTRSTCTAITSGSPRPTAGRSANRPSGPRRPCSCRSAARGRSSSSPTSPATGPCTAT